MKIKVNKEKCIGCGMCASLVPDVFELDEKENKSRVKEGVDLKKYEKEIEEAIESCPARAIEKE